MKQRNQKLSSFEPSPYIQSTHAQGSIEPENTDSKGKGMDSKQANLGKAVSGIILCVFYGWYALTGGPSLGPTKWIAQLGKPQGEAGIDAPATAKVIRDMARVLRTADSRGDTLLATTLFEPLTALTRKMNDHPEPLHTSLRNCRLASAHLINATVAVANGQRWYDREQFENALDACD